MIFYVELTKKLILFSFFIPRIVVCVGSYIWGSTRIDSRTFIIQYLFNWLVLYNWRYWFCYSYADDNTPYVSADNIDRFIKFLEEASEILFEWFNDNLMKINTDKCHLLVSTNYSLKAKLGNFHITDSKILVLIRYFRSKLIHWNNRVYCTPIDRTLKKQFNEGSHSFLRPTVPELWKIF